MNEVKKRGRPAKADSSEARQDLSIPKGCPGFMTILEKYLKQADWTKTDLMSAIDIGNTQLYRWVSGQSNISKATVNRIAVKLAKRLDDVFGSSHGNSYSATDAIDSLLNELLDAAGFAGSVKGKSGDDCWNKIAETKRWKLGYTDVPGWSTRQDKEGNQQKTKPTGDAIEYGENIGRLLGLETEWVYLNFDEMPVAIRQRQVDGIAPLMVALPGRLFDYSFSDPCGSHKFTLTAITDRELVNGARSLEDLPQNEIELIYVEGELGDWGRKILSQYRSRGYPDASQAIFHIKKVIKRKQSIIPVLLIDNATGDFLIEEENSLSLLTLTIQRIKMESFNAFAFNPDEQRLVAAVNQAISVFPIFLEPLSVSNKSSVDHLINSIMEREKSMITELKIRDVLSSVTSKGDTVEFSEAFHFVRHEFCRLNFIVGARCPNNELIWAGLAKNLIEELGGKQGSTHNQLYRDFLRCVAARPEEKLECPKFAQDFNDTWENFARHSPLMESLSAIAIYEIFDVPDYRLFLEVLEQAKVPESGLTFFRVHANAHHFEMFEDTVEWILQQEGGQEAFDKATEFVFETQRKMWIGLIECLQSKQLVTAN